MSTVSQFELQQSESLAKRFAHLASTYFDQPNQAKTPAAKIPLENLFRMLQMYRYDAFSDEPRSGILALGGFGDHPSLASIEDNWHQRIQAAIAVALGDVFAGISRDDALGQIQRSLAWLATDENAPEPEIRTKSRAFLERLSVALD